MHYFPKFILGIKIYMFRTVSLSIIRSFSLYTQQWCMSYSFADSLRAEANAPAHIYYYYYFIYITVINSVIIINSYM
jgi:hypothetical protein